MNNTTPAERKFQQLPPFEMFGYEPNTPNLVMAHGRLEDSDTILIQDRVLFVLGDKEKHLEMAALFDRLAKTCRSVAKQLEDNAVQA